MHVGPRVVTHGPARRFLVISMGWFLSGSLGLGWRPERNLLEWHLPNAYAASGPRVVLDHLEFPIEFGAARYKAHLLRQLKKEARRVDWGASSDSTIQYRFEVTRLAVTKKTNVITVSCSAVGRLPKGRSAKSQLSFSGAPKDHQKLVKHVLSIVARGVMARLAEIERGRRGERAAEVRPPADAD